MESRPETANSDRGRSRPVPQPDEAGYFTPAVAYDDTDIEGTHTTTATGTGTTSTGLTGKSMATANMMSDMVQSRTSGSSMMRPSPVTTSDDDTVHENDHTSTTTVLRHPYQADFQERLAERYGQGQGPNQSQHQHHGHHHHRPEPQPQQAEAAPNPYEYEHEDHEVQYHSHPEIDTDRDHGFLAPGRRVKRRRRHKLHAQTRTRAGAGGQPVAMTGGPVFSKSESHSLSSHHHQHHHRHPERTSRSVESRVHDHDHQHEESASGRSGRVIRRSRSRSVEYRVTFAQPPVECSRKVVCPTSNQNQTQKIIVAAEPCHSNWNQNYQPGCQLLDNYSEFSRASSGLQDTNCVVPQPNTAVYCPEVRKASETDTELFKPDDRCHPALVVDNCIEDRRIYQQREVESRIDVTVTTMDGSGSKQEPKHERRLSGGMRHNLMFGKNFDNLHASYDADDDDEDEGRHQQRFGQKADTRNAEVRERDIKYTPPEPESEEPSTSRRSQPALDRNDPYTYAKPVFSVKKPEQPRYEIRTTPKPRETVERRVEPRHNYDHEHSFPFAGVSPSGNLKIDPKSISFENPKTAVLVANPGKSNVYVKQDRAHTHENLNLAPAPPVPPFPADYTTETQSSYRAIGTDLLANSIRGSKDFMENIRQRMRNAIDPDTTIVIDGKEFPCHYLALQVYSKFFDRHHRHRDKRLEFNIPSDIISPSVFPNLMDWILIDEHEKKMVVSKDNVVGLFSAADYLGMPLLKNDCLEFIKLKVQAEDPSILRMYEEARDNPHCAELLAMISTKLSALFPKLYKSRQFLQMNVRELCLLLQSDSLNIKTELEVYDAAARWLLYDWSARRRYTVEVMSTVRFGLLSPVELSQIQYNMKRDTMPDYGQIFANEEVKVMVEDGLKYALWREQYRTKPSELQKWLAASGIAQPKPRFNLDNALGDPRRASTSFLQNQEQEYMRDKANKAVADSMTAFGNKRLSGNKDNGGQWMDLNREQTRIGAAILIQSRVRGFLTRRWYHKIRMAVITIQTAYRMHKNRNQHQSIRRTSQQISSFLLKSPPIPGNPVRNLKLQGCDSVILLGGNNPIKEPGEYNTAREIYQLHPLDNIWTKMGQLPEPRVQGGAVLYCGHIIFFGGADPLFKTSLDKNVPCGTTWCLKVSGGNWRRLANMRTPRAQFGYILAHGKIWVFGGIDIEGSALSTCEMFDPEANSWTYITAMDAPRFGMAMAKYSDKIWIIGGLTKNPKAPILASVIVYHVTRNIFTPAPAFMYPRAFATATTFYTKIFLFAGGGKVGRLKSRSLDDVSIYEKGHWESVGQLRTPRHGHCQLRLGKYILILGGINSDSQEPLDTCEVFNMIKYTVSTKVAPLPKPIVGCCGIVI